MQRTSDYAKRAKTSAKPAEVSVATAATSGDLFPSAAPDVALTADTLGAALAPLPPAAAAVVGPDPAGLALLATLEADAALTDAKLAAEADDAEATEAAAVNRSEEGEATHELVGGIAAV